jgi:hypothetical protein
MYVTINKQLVIFRNCSSVTSQLCQRDFKHCSGQRNVVWRTKYLSRTTGSAGLIYNRQGVNDFHKNRLSDIHTLLKGVH